LAPCKQVLKRRSGGTVVSAEEKRRFIFEYCYFETFAQLPHFVKFEKMYFKYWNLSPVAINRK